MPRNFDEILETDCTFTVSGETFTWRYLHWTEWADWIDGVDAASQNGDSPKGSEKKDEKEKDETVRESIEELIARVASFLIPEDKERFRGVANDPGKKMAWLQLSEIRDWLVEVQTGRPTQPPSTSTAGRGKTAASSRAS